MARHAADYTDRKRNYVSKLKPRGNEYLIPAQSFQVRVEMLVLIVSQKMLEDSQSLHRDNKQAAGRAYLRGYF